MWRDQAACLGADPTLFESEGRGQIPIDGLRICTNCPVRDDCLDEALATDTLDDDLVWGGTTPKNRAEVRMGRMTRDEAKAAGDRVAYATRTTAERIAQDEPWLLPVEAVAVPIRRRWTA
jgi:hypothetical protein